MKVPSRYDHCDTPYNRASNFEFHPIVGKRFTSFDRIGCYVLSLSREPCKIKDRLVIDTVFPLVWQVSMELALRVTYHGERTTETWEIVKAFYFSISARFRVIPLMILRKNGSYLFEIHTRRFSMPNFLSINFSTFGLLFPIFHILFCLKVFAR